MAAEVTAVALAAAGAVVLVAAVSLATGRGSRKAATLGRASG